MALRDLLSLKARSRKISVTAFFFVSDVMDFAEFLGGLFLFDFVT